MHALDFPLLVMKQHRYRRSIECMTSALSLNLATNRVPVAKLHGRHAMLFGGDGAVALGASCPKHRPKCHLVHLDRQWAQVVAFHWCSTRGSRDTPVAECRFAVRTGSEIPAPRFAAFPLPPGMLFATHTIATQPQLLAPDYTQAQPASAAATRPLTAGAQRAAASVVAPAAR